MTAVCRNGSRSGGRHFLQWVELLAILHDAGYTDGLHRLLPRKVIPAAPCQRSSFSVPTGFVGCHGPL